LFLRALSIQEHLLGPRHPDTAQTLHDLARFRKTQGKLAEAISLTERALTIRSHVLGDAHPKTITTQTLYTQFLQEQTGALKTRTSERHLEAIADPRGNKRHEAVTLSPSEDDQLQEFLDACCELHPRAWCRSADLWHAYEQWSREHQERYPLSRGAFLARLKAHGCRADRTKTARIWRGIALIHTRDDRR
jgi:Tetratricopeptide repeat